MRRVMAVATSPRTQVVFNGVAWVMWLFMIPVVLLVPELRTAILLVSLMSVWANFATHYGAWISARALTTVERVHEHVKPDEEVGE